MYFSRVTLRREALAVNELARVFRGDGYRTHQHLWGLFADHPERRRDFLYREERRSEGPLFYVVSARQPQAGEGPWRVESKPYDPKVRAGERLAFMLRANPVRSRAAERGRRGQRHDVVMDAKRRLREQGQAIVQDDLVQTEGAAWLEDRAGRYGFRLDGGALRVHGYRQRRLFKPRRGRSADAQGGSGREIRFSTVDCEGLLTVTDPQLFLETLLRGVGPAKGFGCGLLLVRRV